MTDATPYHTAGSPLRAGGFTPAGAGGPLWELPCPKRLPLPKVLPLLQGSPQTIPGGSWERRLAPGPRKGQIRRVASAETLLRLLHSTASPLAHPVSFSPPVGVDTTGAPE